MGVAASLLRATCPLESPSLVASQEMCDEETWTNTLLNRGSFCPEDRICDGVDWWQGLNGAVTGLVRVESCDSIETDKMEWALEILTEAPMQIKEGGLVKKRVGFGEGEVVVFEAEMPAAELFK